MTAIDLNVDPGEGCNTDEALLALTSSANIVCGWYAGDVNTMHRIVGWALRQDVSIDARPSFPDRENFGHTEMHLQPDEIYTGVLFQIDELSAIVHTQDGKLAHVRAHDALYSQASRDRPLAMVIVHTIRDLDPSLVVFGLAEDELIEAACELSLQAKEEVFADCSYNADGSFVKRGTPGALIDSEDTALDQTLAIIHKQCVEAVDGTWVPVRAEAVCLYGDGAYALAFA